MNWFILFLVLHEAFIISANTRVKHSQYKFNEAFTVKNLKNEIVHYEYDAFDKDSTFWANHRLIQLKKNELAFIALQSKIEAYKKSEHYLDSVDISYNKITFWDITLNGIGYRNRFKQEEFYFNPMLQRMNLIGVGGFRYGLGGFYAKKFDNAHKIKISPVLDYGFRNKDLKGQLGFEYSFLPLKFGSVKIEGGDLYERITKQTSILNLFAANNFINNRFIEISHSREITNGFYGRLKFSYSDKQSISGIKVAPWVDKVADYMTKDTLLTSYFEDFNKPVEFERYRASLIELRLQYRFNQKYIIKRNEKLIVGTTYPEIELTYTKGIPTLFKSDVNFDFLELKVSDEINFGNYGDAKWKVISGSFLNKVDLRFVENKFFRGSDFSWFSNPMQTYQTLDSTFYTSAPYFQAFYFHHFNGFFLNKIPLINRLKFESVAGTSILLIQDINYSHAEFSIGVERKFKIKRQYLKYGFYYTSRINGTPSALFKLKFGIDYFNSFTNSWSY